MTTCGNHHQTVTRRKDNASSFERPSTSSGSGGSSIKSMMTRSTIYQRHKNRRCKTLTLIDDQRPPVVRVMSGLPLFSLIFPPYQPPERTNNVTKRVEQVTNNNNNNNKIIGSEFQETNIFSLHHEQQQKQPTSKVPLKDVGVAPVAASSIAGVTLSATLLRFLQPSSSFISSTRTTTTKVTSPFQCQRNQPSKVQTPTITRPSSILNMQSLSMMFANSALMKTTCLFTTKAFFERCLRGGGDDDNQRLSPVSIVSSCASGGTVAAFRKMLTKTPATVSVGTEILAATLYFTTYDVALGAHLSTCEREDEGRRKSAATAASNPFAVLIAGGLAGVAYEGVLRLPHARPAVTLSSLTCIPPVPYTNTAFYLTVLSRAILKAGPTHALIFLGYETTLHLLTTMD